MATLNQEQLAKRRLTRYYEQLVEKRLSLNNLLGACNRSVLKLKANTNSSIDQLRAQRDEQVKEILQKYNVIENELAKSSKNVINELSCFMDGVVKPQKSKIERANEILKKTIASNRQEGVANLSREVEGSLRKILNVELPDLRLSKLLELKPTGTQYRHIEVAVVDPCSASMSSSKTSELKRRQGLGDEADCCYSEAECPTDSEMVPDAVTETEHQPLAESHSLISSQRVNISRAPTLCEGQKVSFSASVMRCQMPGFGTHIAQSGRNMLVVDSRAPTIYNITDTNDVQHHVKVDRSHMIVGMTTCAEFVYVQYMEINEYRRLIYVYNTNGDFIRKWNTPNLLGASLAVVKSELVIVSQDKLTVCSASGTHLKDIALPRRCIRKLSTLMDSDSVIVSSCSMNEVTRLNIKTEEAMWTSTDVQAPAATSCDKLGRVYVLVKPCDICVLNGDTGELLTRATISATGGVIEDIYVTENGLLVTVTNHKAPPSGNYCVVNTHHISDVC